MTVDYIEHGSGPALLFLPGSYSTHSAWTGIRNALQGRYRTIATSLPGYGGSTERRRADNPQIQDMIDFVEQLVDRIGEPVHLVGHSFGGQIALAAALAQAAPLASLISFEGNPIYACPDTGAFAWATETAEMCAKFTASVADGNPDAAAIIIDYWSTPGTFAALADPIQDFCRNHATTNLLDWRTAQSFTPDFADFTALSLPCAIIRGARANQAIVDISDLLCRYIPDSTGHVVDGADHFLISTHPGECAALIDAHMARI